MAQQVKAFGQILQFPDGMSEADMAEAIRSNEPDLNPDYKAPKPEALDYAKGFASGANKLVSGVGYLAEAAGANETGKAIREFGDRGAAYWNEQMSPGGKKAAESQVFVDDPESITGLRLGDDAGKALLMGAAQSLPSMFAAALPGVAITKGIQALASLGLAGGAGATIPLLAGTAAPVGIGSQVIARVPSAVGFGAAEGVVSGGMNAAGLKSSIEGMSDKELLKSPVYQALRAQHGEEKARTMLADQAASDLFGKTAVSTGAIGALTGGGALGSAYQKATSGAADGIMMTGLKGAGQEAIQETPQSGGEKYIENITRKEYIDPSIDPMVGVIAEAASGGAIGAFTGGLVGAGSAVNLTRQAEAKAQEINVSKINPIHEAATVDEAIVAANEAVKGKPVTKEDVLRTVDPTLADIEALTGVKPNETQETAINTRQPQAAEVLDIVLPDNTSVKAQWKIVDADQLAASMKEDVNQPRDRTRAASDIQIKSITNAPDYRRLSDSPVMDVGAPVVDQDGHIVAGNGRFAGLSQAYDQGTATEYMNQLREDAARKGLSIEGIAKPVLVRQLSEPVDTRKLAIASNSGTTLQMSALEQANLDAERMKGIENLDVNDLGDITLTPRNLTQLKDSLGTYAGTELGAMVDKGGQLSQEGMRRVRNAMLAKAYGNSPSLEKLVESTDSDMRNVLGALTKSANRIIKTKGDVKPLMEAVDTYSQLKATGQPVDNFLAQQDAFSDGLSKEAEGILRFIDTNVRSQKKLTDFFKGNFVEVDTTSDDMFSTPQPALQSVEPKSDGATRHPNAKAASKDASWVIKNKSTGEVLFETFDKAKVDALNTSKYEAVPIYEHLTGLNKDASITSLEKHLKDNGYDFRVEPASVRDIDALDSTKKARKELAEKQAKLFKKKVVFVKADGPFKINGVMVPSIADTIFVDIRTAKPFDAIMAHELSHWMEQEKPAVYKEMIKSLKTVIIAEGYAEKYGIEGATKADITKEIAGDIMGDNFAEESFWNKVAEANPSAFKDIAAAIIKWIKGVVVKAKANGMGSDQWVKDATKAQDIIAKAVAQYTKSESVPVSAESKPKFSKLKETSATYSGYEFKTGLPVTFTYLHNKSSATKIFGKPKKSSDFNRYYDPSGKYVIAIPESRTVPDYGSFEKGQLHFDNPLVIENDNLNWKKELSDKYKGLRGKSLSNALIADGYDGVVTVDSDKTGKTYPTEILDLTSFDEAKAKFSRAPKVDSKGKPLPKSIFEWFGDSKVVDDQGRPLVVYHGGNSDISTFSHEFAGSGADQFGSGFYFATDSSIASGYADNTKDGANVIPAYLSIQNPLNSTHEQKLTKAQIKKILTGSPTFEDALWNFGDWQYEGKARVTNEAVDSYYGSQSDTLLQSLHPMANDFYGDQTEAFAKVVKKTLGYDGVQVDFPETGQKFFIAWDSNQIKSSTGNNGQFSKTNNDIRFSRAPKLYSKLEQALEAANDKVFSTGPQVKLWLQSNAGKLGIKKDEIYWSGIDNWLDAQGKVSKQQVVEFVRNNGVQVEDVTLGVTDPDIIDRMDTIASKSTLDQKELEALRKEWAELNERLQHSGPKHNNDKLTLPGGTDYKELVVTVPTIEPHNADDSTHFGDVGIPSAQDLRAYENEISSIRKEVDSNFADIITRMKNLGMIEVNCD